MLRIVQDKERIKRCYRLFSKHLRSQMNFRTSVTIGYPGGNFKARVWWSHHLGIWMHGKKGGDGSLWNAFGTEHPNRGAHLSITCEINFPCTGMDRRFGAAFAADGNERLYVIHRGRIGGGRRGIGKGTFSRLYRGVWTFVDEGDKETAVAVVGCLSSDNFARQVARFIHCVGKLKQRAAASASLQESIPFEPTRFQKELTGETCEDLPLPPWAACDHALIVEDLAAALEHHGYRTANDMCRDLVVMDQKKKVQAVFQVITDSRPHTVRDRAGRLLLNGPDDGSSCRLILVSPRPLDEETRGLLAAHHIDILTYTWRNGHADFPEIETITSSLAPDAQPTGSPPGW